MAAMARHGGPGRVVSGRGLGGRRGGGGRGVVVGGGDGAADGEAEAGEAASLVGQLRVSAGNRNEAYVSVGHGMQKDVVVDGRKNRNCALDGDEVRVVLCAVEEWKPDAAGQWAAAADASEIQSVADAEADDDPQRHFADHLRRLLAEHTKLRPTARVVEVTKHGPRRERVVARLEAWDAGLGVKNTARLAPIDPRLPFMACREPRDAALNAAYHAALARTPSSTYQPPLLVKARVVQWREGTAYPMAEIVGVLGEVGQRDAETVALLANEGLDVTHPDAFPAAVDERPTRLAFARCLLRIST